jgi:peroxiredoxin family protein
VHYALILASAAAAIGKPSVLFFSMGACRTLATRQNQALPSGDSANAPGWHSLAAEPRFLNAQDQDTQYKAQGIADMETLLSACAALGTRFIVCETGLRSIDLAPWAPPPF